MPSHSILSLEFPIDDIGVISINDPNKGANVLSRSVLDELEQHLDTLDAHEGLAGLVIRSAKPGNFIAGADLREFVADIDQPSEAVIKVAQRGQSLFGRLSNSNYVTVAAIDGLCVGGGAELAIWCDRRVMARHATTSYAFPEVKLGLFPGWGGTVRTPRIVGLSNAVELVTGGEPIDAETAMAMGLAEVAPPESLLDAAIAIVRSEQESKQYLNDRKRWAAPIKISETELGFLGATASAYIQGQTKGHYPAPLAALEVLLGGACMDAESACELEASEFVKLFGSTINRALLNVFFLTDRNKKPYAPATGAESIQPLEINSATVLGAGIMGQGIAAANVKRKIPIALGDVSPESVARGVQGIISEVSFNRKTRGPDVERALAFTPLVNGTMSDAELAASDVVIEAIYENAEAKRELYARLEPQLGAQAILCSNTSTIPITELAKDLQHPERFCGLHFFNPVRKMPLVEVIRGEHTSEQTIATAVAYAKKIKKSPIVVNDGPGFLVNRVLLPYMNEALLLLEAGASIKAVDRAATKFGMPMGPITLYDTVGLDVAVHAGEVMKSAFPDRVVPSQILPAMLAADRKGKKNGRGFFDYVTDKKGRSKPQPSDAVDGIIQSVAQPTNEAVDLTDRLFLPMLLEATRLIEDGIVAEVRDVDLGLIYGIGFPPFRGGLFCWADTIGSSAIVEKLKPYAELGERYQPTDMLLELATSDKKFYG
ncbi:MAG: 3-hydroxyacyl-CoA dehydrogenase NAD-binding domain-containing protein [Planctomycetota bacterium]